MPSLLEVTGEVVRELRGRRESGAPVTDLLRYLSGMGLNPVQMTEHVMQAFRLGLDESRGVLRWTADGTGSVDDDRIEATLGREIDGARDRWRDAVFPEVMRRRDRLAFIDAAKAHDAIILLIGSCPAAGEYVGRPGYRACPPGVSAEPRATAPNKGLLAVDPSGPEAAAAITTGLSIGGPEEGHVLRDPTGAALYRGYELHGVYDRRGRNAWTPAAGEKIRGDLNRRLGEELVLSGPRDVWEHRGDSGPRPPVIVYLPDGSVTQYLDADEMRKGYESLGIDWDVIWPDEGEAR